MRENAHSAMDYSRKASAYLKLRQTFPFESMSNALLSMTVTGYAALRCDFTKLYVLVDVSQAIPDSSAAPSPP